MSNLKNKIYSQLGLLAGIIISLIIFYLVFRPPSFFDFILSNTLYVFLIFNSNRVIFSRLCNFDKITGVSFLKLVITLILSFVVGLLWYLLLLLFGILILPYLHINEFLTIIQNDYRITISFLVVIILVFLVLELFKGWKKEAVNIEKRKYEELRFQYEILKSQINPHFLFNSLNILNSIISIDQEQAQRFVQNFSKIYRYVLEKRNSDYVLLSEELKFIESYLYLIKSRHLNKVDVKVEIKDDTKYSIIPMSLQLLVENAIKHNAATLESPLVIRIYLDNGCIVVSNNINKKNIVEETSRVGLDNLSKRYKYLTQKDIAISNNGEEFVIKLPAIKVHK